MHLIQKMGRCIKLIVNWRSSIDEQAAGDHVMVLVKGTVKVDLKDIAMKKS